MSHKREIEARRRKNNIYGEVFDHVINAFLAMGGTAAFYNTGLVPHIIGRSDSQLYFVHVTKKTSYSKVEFAELWNSACADAARAIGAIPLFALDKSYSAKCTFFDANGKKMTSLL